MSDYTPWFGFFILLVVMLFLDLWVFNRKAHKISIRESLSWSLVWIIIALLFNIYIYFSRGSTDALNFLTAYLIEKSLSIDNLFVFLLIFHYFKTPESSQHKVLFYGVVSAIFFRAIFIWLGLVLVEKFHWIIYFFGAFLIFSGLKFAFEKDREMDPSKNAFLKLFRRFVPMTKNYEGDHFFIKEHAKWIATPLVAVLIAIETTDIIFAVDSIPAVLVITYDPFIVFTSNIFAVLGLRSLFFALSGMMSLFHYLHYGLAFILIYVGSKMLLSEVYQIPNIVTFLIVLTAISSSIILSLTRK